tara:strand:- start:7097 stop:7522 length:426 start_codon:yes stop_codon:yes gene_type:complete
MRKIITKPQYFFTLLAIIMVAIGFFYKENAIELATSGVTIDLDIWSLSLISALFFILIAVNYASLTITQKKAKKGLTIIHILIQIIALIPLLYFIFNSESPKTYEEISGMNVILLLAFVMFLLATIIHLINFITSLVATKD